MRRCDHVAGSGAASKEGWSPLVPDAPTHQPRPCRSGRLPTCHPFSSSATGALTTTRAPSTRTRATGSTGDGIATSAASSAGISRQGASSARTWGSPHAGSAVARTEPPSTRMGPTCGRRVSPTTSMSTRFASPPRSSPMRCPGLTCSKMRRCPMPGGATVVLRGRPALARQPRRLPLALDPHRSWRHLQTPRTAPLLRQRAHRRRVRRGHGPAGDGSFIRDDDAEHLRPPVADRRGQDPNCCFWHGCCRPFRYDEAAARHVSFTRAMKESPRRAGAISATEWATNTAPDAPGFPRRPRESSTW